MISIWMQWNCRLFSQMIIDSTSGIWRLQNNEIIRKIFDKLNKNLISNKTMFFILNRNIFQKNSSYWRNKLESKYIYTTNAFIPQYCNDPQIYLENILNDMDNIRIYNKFNNKEQSISKYREITSLVNIFQRLIHLMNIFQIKQ